MAGGGRDEALNSGKRTHGECSMGQAVRKTEPEVNSTTWAGSQAYTIAVLCLFLGLAVGYLLRGSFAAPVTTAVNGAAPAAEFGQAQLPGMGGMPTGQQPSDLVDKAAEPMLATLKQNPKDAGTLAKLGNLYYDAQLYPQAIEYYARSLQIAPANAEVRTDMGTAYFYSGNADRALAEFDKSLSHRPNHGQTLFNMGIVKWQGKHDAKGAIAAWEKLLQTNPDYPEKEKVRELMSHAQQG